MRDVPSTCLVFAVLLLPSIAFAQETERTAFVLPWGPNASTEGSWMIPSGDPRERDTVTHEEEEKGTETKAARASDVTGGIFVGTGLPSVLNAGLTMRIGRYFGFGANAGFIPTIDLPVYGQASISYVEYDTYVRVYPGGGGFFLSSGIGYQTVHGALSETVTVPAIAGYTAGGDVQLGTEASVRSLVFVPQIGYLHRFDSGFSLGLDAGAIIPVSTSDVSISNDLPSQVPASYTSQAMSDERSAIERVGKQIIPTFGFRAGYMF